MTTNEGVASSWNGQLPYHVAAALRSASRRPISTNRTRLTSSFSRSTSLSAICAMKPAPRKNPVKSKVRSLLDIKYNTVLSSEGQQQKQVLGSCIASQTGPP